MKTNQRQPKLSDNTKKKKYLLHRQYNVSVIIAYNGGDYVSILITFLGLCSQNDWMYGQMASHRMPSNKLWMYYSKIALDKIGWLKTIYYLPISQLWKCVDNSNEKIIDLRKSSSWLAIFVVVRCSRLWPSTIYWHDDRHICVIHTHTHLQYVFTHRAYIHSREREKKGPVRWWMPNFDESTMIWIRSNRILPFRWLFAKRADTLIQLFVVCKSTVLGYFRSALNDLTAWFIVVIKLSWASFAKLSVIVFACLTNCRTFSPHDNCLTNHILHITLQIQHTFLKLIPIEILRCPATHHWKPKKNHTRTHTHTDRVNAWLWCIIISFNVYIYSVILSFAHASTNE